MSTATVSDKQIVRELIERLPAAVSLEQILEEIEVLRAVRVGIQAAESGELISHEEVDASERIWHHARREPRLPD